MYNQLLTIKAHREKNAAQALRRQQDLVEEQVQTVQRVRDEAAQFSAYRVRQEQQLFEEIKGKLVTLRAVEDMNRNVAILREHEALLEVQILSEEKRLNEARKALEAARQRHLTTVRECEKFDQFVAAHRAIVRQEQMMKEETELEETASAAHRARQEA